ncbi:MAG TPA: hypothetical protein VK701_04780 [Solirubrobacteraceae bacterium]|nr:hypothetical protein [Solirubrobacteraceae bacterium]
MRLLAGQPSLFTVTRTGLRVCDVRGIKTCEVSDTHANYLVKCAAVAASLERCYPAARLIGERELRRDEREWEHPIASAQLGASRGGESCLHRPDIVLWPTPSEHDLPFAVEVELTISPRGD